MLLSFTRHGALPLGKMGARLQVHPASVTNLVDGLERAGYVAREPHPTDGRTTLAAITASGARSPPGPPRRCTRSPSGSARWTRTGARS